MPPELGLEFQTPLSFTGEEIQRFAALVGDPNATHFDEDAAMQSRFGGIIASGAQISAVMMGRSAAYFGKFGPSIALEFDFQFRKAVRANETCTAHWTVTRVKRSSLMRGHLISIKGVLRGESGACAVRSSGTILLEDPEGMLSTLPAV